LIYFCIVNTNLKSYKLILISAILIFALLVYIQFNWLKNAITIQKDLEKKTLISLMPELTLKVNGLDHNFFHSVIDSIPEDKMTLVNEVIHTQLESHGFDDAYFAIFKDTITGLYTSNTDKFKSELMGSEIRSCISCITSFSIANKISKKIDESEESFRERLFTNSEFQYYSPINKINSSEGEVLWLSLYYPSSFYGELKVHFPVFILSIFLLILLLIIFYYILSSLDKYKKISKVKDDFFNNMTHEFKTPLSSIRLASRMLRSNFDAVKSKNFLELIEKESILLENQIDDLLTLSMLENDKLKLSFSTIGLHDVINNISNRLNSILINSNVELNLELGAIKHSILGNKIHLSNCICNLVENSIKYSSAVPRIDILTANENEFIVVKVRDFGVGISKDLGDKVFKKFVRGQQGNQYKGQGFGLGLSYVKSIVDLHNGSIELNESYTLGCEFILKFVND